MQRGISLWALGCMCVALVDAQNFGTLLGKFPLSASHGVSGTVYMVDSRRIRIRNFNYDGLGPDAFFWYGTTSRPDTSGKILANEKGSSGVLGSYSNADIILTFPEGTTVCSAKWLSVWCRQFRSDFAHITIDCTDMCTPAPLDIGMFSSLSNGVSSGTVTILDSRRVRIQAFSYDGTDSDTYFLAGSSTISASNGVRIPDENGGTGQLGNYSSQTIELLLPADLTMAKYRWISVYNTNDSSNYGSVNIPEKTCVPPYVEMSIMTSLPNCLAMNDNFNVAWEVKDGSITFEFIGALEGDAGYMSFGISGSDNASVMVGGDAMVVYLDNGQAKVEDYTMTAKALCAGGNGVCPDTTKSGMNDLELLSSGFLNGVTTLRFKRPLSTGDSQDKTIVTDREMFTVWGTGSVNDQKQVTKHTQRLVGNQKVHFGQIVNGTCKTIRGQPDTTVTPWPASKLSCQTSEFSARIGPTGGKKGYPGITGQISWGIAWYINGYLIPELTVKRGNTYTFYVEGGLDRTISARYHPLYITNDSVGGYDVKLETEKQSVVNYAGTTQNATGVFGTDGRYCEYTSSAKPEDYASFEAYNKTMTSKCDPGPVGKFTWTPDGNTPDLVFYQCFTHNYLGWKIHVVNECPPENGATTTTLDTVHLSLVMFVAVGIMVYIF